MTSPEHGNDTHTDRIAPMHHIAIRPSHRRPSLGLREMWSYRELLYFFAWRDVKVRYKQSIFGVGWALLQPLTLMVAFTVFFGRLAQILSDGMPRPIFYYSALVPWTYFSQAVTQGTNSLIASGGLLTKVYFPRLLLPISPVIAGLFDFAIAFLFLGAIEGYYLATGASGIAIGARVVLLPLFLLLAVLTAAGVSLWLSSLNARYRDVRFVVTFIIQFWMFASPIAYPASLIPERWRDVYFVNPMASVVEGFRWCLTGQGLPPGRITWISTLAVIIVIITGLRHFRKHEGTVADVV